MPKVSEEYKERKRELLLESALQCFSEKGYYATTIDDIAAYSKTSKGFIYNYFNSKEELYIALMEERTSRTFTALRERFATIEGATGKIKELFRMYREAKVGLQWQGLIRVHMEFWIHSARHENLRDIMVSRYKYQYRDFLKEIIEEGKASGEFEAHVDATVIASMFWGIIDGLSLHYSVIGDEYEYRSHFIQAEQMVLLYVGKK
ncbi:TetR/AcrR family transcriptional regulator [Ectobacillus antri]|jgi:AcrR family transcriptional regulator|uniref:TetR/AcrR family transcriptional regulator n=1 Tax=Ectobacillus antri TaxID=2486280 RepID=A0ABT6H6C2_9BACI|nr:TetR/AcrR family transcriptional regulator [Ectobacillus antri]MDG4657830.1 TetR/AcrR family transcriptional regulator [Ectobacillus antri]MDG5754779.1 TetR/AcrR family transcriptional regulator [Ectobacillus antri]